ncbi:hypothetical protein JHW43_009509 [Diplocarpon mali]|nr:hypothetical protein JHW43_009509 [Diplocarpon mali]
MLADNSTQFQLQSFSPEESDDARDKRLEPNQTKKRGQQSFCHGKLQTISPGANRSHYKTEPQKDHEDPASSQVSAAARSPTQGRKVDRNHDSVCLPPLFPPGKSRENGQRFSSPATEQRRSERERDAYRKEALGQDIHRSKTRARRIPLTSRLPRLSPGRGYVPNNRPDSCSRISGSMIPLEKRVSLVREAYPRPGFQSRRGFGVETTCPGSKSSSSEAYLYHRQLQGSRYVAVGDASYLMESPHQICRHDSVSDAPTKKHRDTAGFLGRASRLASPRPSTPRRPDRHGRRSRMAGAPAEDGPGGNLAARVPASGGRGIAGSRDLVRSAGVAAAPSAGALRRRGQLVAELLLKNRPVTAFRGLEGKIRGAGTGEMTSGSHMESHLHACAA